jgi:hypothetical protein
MRIIRTRAGWMDKGIEEGLFRVDSSQGGAQEAPTDSFFVGMGAIEGSLENMHPIFPLPVGQEAELEHRGQLPQPSLLMGEVYAFWSFGTMQGEGLQYGG